MTLIWVSMLHKPRGQSPKTLARLNGTLTQQKLRIMCSHRSNNNFWIVIVNKTTMITNIAHNIVPVRYTPSERRVKHSASVTMFRRFTMGSFVD